MGGVGPMFGQVHHFLRAAKEPVPYAIERYTTETRRLYGVLNERLKDRKYLADEYSIADIATYPWTARYEWHKTRLEDFPHVKRWFDAISARPSIQRRMKPTHVESRHPPQSAQIASPPPAAHNAGAAARSPRSSARDRAQLRSAQHDVRPAHVPFHALDDAGHSRAV